MSLNNGDETAPLLNGNGNGNGARHPSVSSSSAQRARSLSVATTVHMNNTAIMGQLRFTAAVLTLAFDAALMLALFFVAGTAMVSEAAYLDLTVKNYDYYTSTLDVFLLAVCRLVVLAPLYWNIARLESQRNRAFAAVVVFGSLLFALVKVVLVNVSSPSSSSPAEPLDIFAFNNGIIAASIVLTCIEAYQVFAVAAVIERVLKFVDDYEQEENSKDKEAEEKKRKEEEEKSKKRKASLKRLFALALPEWFNLTLAMIALLLNSATTLVVPLVLGAVVGALDPSSGDNAMTQLNQSVVFLVILFAVGSVFAFIRAWLFTLVGQRIVARLRTSLFDAVISQEVAFFDKTRTGEITSRLTSDTQIIQNTLTVNISMLVRHLITIIGTIVILFVLSWELTLVMCSVVPVVAVGAVVYGKYVQKMQKLFQDELAGSTTIAEEVISNLRTVRSFSKEQRSTDNYGVAIEKTFQIGRKIAIAMGAFQGVIGFVPLAAIALILWFGGKLVIEGGLTIEFLVSFLMYTLTVAMSFAFLSAVFGDFMAAVGASERIFELLDRKPTINTKGGKQIDDFKGQVAFDDVTFTYPERQDQVVLKNVSLALEPGKVLALVGPSGGGKSTVVSLMERFYDVTSGSVMVDGQDLRSLDPVWYRSQVALVSQEPVLFATSIRDNITYGIDREITDAEVEAAAKAANAHEFIIKFQDGYKTEVGERGVRLSGGQKQRVAISRALLMNPRILLLDEATSALDAESEFLVQDAIDKAMKNRTVLVIAHRLSTVKNADAIAVLSGGSIVELGSHDQLVQLEGGLYRKLVNRQLAGNQDISEAFAEIAKEQATTGAAAAGAPASP